VLESQLRSGQITTREFIRGLLKSDKFRNDFYRCNSNYRVVEQVVGRVLGRPVHGEAERIAWSIVIAQKGLPGFIDALLDSQEYLEAFGDDLVPYQRSRTLAGQAIGAMPFNQQAPPLRRLLARSDGSPGPRRPRHRLGTQRRLASAGLAGRPTDPGRAERLALVCGHRWLRAHRLRDLDRPGDAQHRRPGLRLRSVWGRPDAPPAPAAHRAS